MVHAPTTSLRRFLGGLADYLYPPVCLGCDADLESGTVCTVCNEQVMSGRLDICPKCGRPLHPGTTGCGRCGVPISLSRIRALGRYAPPFSGLVRELKYRNRTALVRLLGRALCGLAESDPELGRADIICPVPLHRARLRERGYNQAELLAREVGAGIGVECANLLIRHRNTRTQTRLPDDRARHANVRRAFVPENALKLNATRVLLVDDVMTSGATLDAAGRQLLLAGAGAVVGLVIAAA